MVIWQQKKIMYENKHSFNGRIRLHTKGTTLNVNLGIKYCINIFYSFVIFVNLHCFQRKKNVQVCTEIS